MRFHHSVLLAALAIAPVCAERIKVSDERGIVNSTLSAVGGVDCGGGGLRSSGGGSGDGGLGCDQIIRRRMVGGVTAAAGGRAEKKDAVVVGGRGATADDELRCNDVGQRVRSRGISGSRRGKQDVSSPTANPRTTIPGGGDRRAMGAVDALDCGEGGGIASTTRTMTAMTRKRTSVSSPTAAAAATTAIAHCSTAGGARRRRR
jgi:hypothetical protein